MSEFDDLAAMLAEFDRPKQRYRSAKSRAAALAGYKKKKAYLAENARRGARFKVGQRRRPITLPKLGGK